MNKILHTKVGISLSNALLKSSFSFNSFFPIVGILFFVFLTGSNGHCSTNLDNGHEGFDYTSEKITIIIDYGGDTEFCAGLSEEHGEEPCEGYVTLPITVDDECSTDIEVSWILMNVVDSSDYIVDSGDGQYSGNLEVGQYILVYAVEDSCSNTAEEVITFDVIDCKAPSVSCDELVIELMITEVPEFVVTCDMYLQPCSGCGAAVSDNCPGELNISFSADTSDTEIIYTCDDLGAGNPVEIWVTDAAGNQDYCTTNTIVQANDGQCSPPLILSGTVTTEAGTGIEGVDIYSDSYFIFSDITTDSNGFYTYNIDEGYDFGCSLRATSDNNTHSYVSTMDIIAIKNHILGINEFTSGYQWIAADANDSKTITGMDMVEIRRFILWDENYQNGFPSVPSWRFVDADFRFASNPLEGVAYQIDICNQWGEYDVLVGDFIGVVIGNPDGSWDANLLDYEDRSTGEYDIAVDNIELSAGESYEIDFSNKDIDIKGYQFTLGYNPEALEFDGIIEGIAKEENFGLAFVNDGFITTSWNGENTGDDVLFSLKFTAKADGKLSEMLNINSRYTKAEAYGDDGSLKDVVLNFDGDSDFYLYQNVPNPFSDATDIRFVLQEQGRATLTITDITGKVVKVIEGEFDRGMNTVTIRQDELGQSGIFYYRLETSDFTAVKSMILTK